MVYIDRLLPPSGRFCPPHDTYNRMTKGTTNRASPMPINA